VYLPALSIFDGTWSSGEAPVELRDFLLMQSMNWSWMDLQATPPYVQSYCWHFLQMQRGGGR
jgi:hypothetical protein